MAKKYKKITAGNLVKEIIHTAPEPRDTPRARAEKSKATSAAQKIMNDKTARAKLEMLLAANFERKDLFVTLTYRDEDLPTTRTAASKNLRKWIKQVREYRKRKGFQTTYVYTTENRHGDGRLHHHMVINATNERDIDIFRSLWNWGDVIDIEYVGKYTYSDLAGYITKEGAADRPVGAQMWTPSKNLKRPKVTTCYVPNNTELSVPLGVTVIENESKRTEYGSYSYIKYYIAPNYWDLQLGEARENNPLLSCL